MPIQPMETGHTVRGYDCGYGGPFKPLSLADYFQEAAGDHASILGIGMDAMFAAGRTWMLSRIDIEAESLPRAGDEVRVRTWPAGTERIFARRCLELRSARGELLAGALYEYLIVDLEKRRPLRPEKILDPAMKCDLPPSYSDLAPGVQDLPEFAGAAPGFSDFASVFRIQASPRHIDYNGHVNNAHLIDWLCDAVPKTGRGEGRFRRIKVDFIAEVMLGEDIEARCFPASRPREYASVLLRDGQAVARALTRWD